MSSGIPMMLLTKKNPVEITPPSVNAYCRAALIKTAWYWQKLVQSLTPLRGFLTAFKPFNSYLFPFCPTAGQADKKAWGSVLRGRREVQTTQVLLGNLTPPSLPSPPGTDQPVSFCPCSVPVPPPLPRAGPCRFRAAAPLFLPVGR